MKAAETKSTHTQQHSAADKSSASQEQERAFFSESTSERNPFFSPAGGVGLQAKLAGNGAPFFQPARVPGVQMKCAACAAEEREQAGDLDSEPLTVQRMPAFESDEAEVQRKPILGNALPLIQRMPAFESDEETTEAGEETIQRKVTPGVNEIASTAATLQPKCEACEAEEEEKREEPTEETPQMQMMVAFDGAAEAGNGDDNKKESALQFSLTIGQPGDAYEREADAMAEKVVSSPESQLQATLGDEEKTDAKPVETIQRQPLLQKAHDDSLSANDEIASRISHRQGQGSPLDDATRSRMEPAFGADFSGVRVHTDNEAAQLSQDLEAQAFTHKSDIYFNSGKYNPASQDGERLLAHELTHTVQQGATQLESGKNVSSPDLSIQAAKVVPPITHVENQIQLKLEDYEKPGHGKNPKKRLEAEIANEVDQEAIEEGKKNPGNYERPNPIEKKQKAQEFEGSASPDINEAEIAKPKNEELAIEGEVKVEHPEELVEPGEEKPVEPQPPKTAELSTMKQAQARSERLIAHAQAIEQPQKPEEVSVPKPFMPVDAAGEPLPFDMAGEQQVNETAKKTQELRDKGQTLIMQAWESMSQADLMGGKLELTRSVVAESDQNVNTLEGAYKTRREYVQQSEEGLKVAEEKQKKEAEEAPKYLEESNKQKAESETVAAESREKKAENEQNRPEDLDDRAKAEKQGREIEKAANAGESIDNAFGQSQQQAQLLLQKNTEAKEKNTATKGKIDQMHTLLDQGDAKVVELRTANTAAKAQMDARAGEPDQVRQKARQMERAGESMVADSQEKEKELHQVQRQYQGDLAAIPKFDLERQLAEETAAGRSPDTFIQRQPDGMAQGDYSGMIDVFQGTFLDPNRNLTLQQREAAARQAQERRAREVQRINAAYDKPFEQYTAWEKIKAGLSAKWHNFTDWITHLTFGNIVGGIGHLILDTINPLSYLKGIGAGFMKVVNGLVNAVAALLRGDFWGFLKGAADTATGVAVIAGTITGLALVISALMTALMIFTLGAAAPVAIPVLTTMASIMAWSGPIAYWSGLVALALNFILGIKSLVDMATADSADQLAAETDDLTQDIQGAVTGGGMALLGKAGMAAGPTLVAEAQALTLAAGIGGRGWLVKALVVQGLADTWALLSMRGVRGWFSSKFKSLRDWLRGRGGRDIGEGSGVGGVQPGEFVDEGAGAAGSKTSQVVDDLAGDFERVVDLPGGRHKLKYKRDGRSFLCSPPPCRDVTEFIKRYPDEINQHQWIQERLDEIAEISDEPTAQKALNQLENDVKSSIPPKITPGTGVQGFKVGEELTIPYKGTQTRGKVIEINDEFVIIQYRTRSKRGGDVKESIKREDFERLLTDERTIRWSQERQRLMTTRPKFGETEVEEKAFVEDVWNRAKQSDGKVYDPDGKELTWDRSKNRWNQWHMGHQPGKEYVKLVDQYVDGEITYEKFLEEYRNAANYRPEDPIKNISHEREL